MWNIFGLASARAYKIGVVGNNWLVGNTVFSETALRIFLIFCMKLVDYKGRRVTEPGFWKKFLIWRYSPKGLQISPKKLVKHFDIFLKYGSNKFFGFWPEVSTKYDLQFGWNLFFRKIFNLEIFDFEIVINCPNWSYWPFSRLCIISFSHNDRWAWCLVIFLQFAGPVSVFLFLLKIITCTRRQRTLYE